MARSVDPVLRLTETALPAAERRRALNDFALGNGWYPSDAIEDYPGAESISSGHLLVEHGMANSAVITFLRPASGYKMLSHRDRCHLLALSYNNLVDWHFFPDPHGLTIVFNRNDPAVDFHVSDRDAWRAEAFEEVTRQQVEAQLKSLDNALISTLSFWKRALASEVGDSATNDRLSALFNIVFMVRALEDHRRWTGQPHSEVLLHAAMSHPNAPITDVLLAALRRLGPRQFPAILREQASALATFDPLDSSTISKLFTDFYRIRHTPYNYDFSVISKHALSRIYEHYSSLLRSDDSDQLRFFPDLPTEVSNKSIGTYYSPQFVARFFARYLQQNSTPKQFREFRVIDPACGSGIFLRTVLEMQCESPFFPLTKQKIRKSFRNVVGLDVDQSACEASRLSLSLLHLVVTDQFPRTLDIRNVNALDFMEERPSPTGKFDAVVSNPPYVKWDALSGAEREKLATYLEGYGSGKLDLFLGLLKVGLDLVRPGGFLLYVLPHTFLVGRSSARLRSELAKKFWIRVLADLSDINVFEDVSSYTILLIAERKSQPSTLEPPATIVRCRDLVGHALQAALEGRHVENESYQVFESGQEVFSSHAWKLLPPQEQRLQAHLSNLPRLRSFAEIREGMSTGCDQVFVRPMREVPKAEHTVWRPLLSDREMVAYAVPDSVKNAVFYPYEGENKLEPQELRDRYPETWRYLKSHKEGLESRKGVEKEETPWWSPERPRPPERMFRPKIISPHLMLLPRFALDAEGRFAIKRSPVVFPANDAGGTDLLLYILGVLNSPIGHWQIRTQSHKYSKGYAMIEPRTLKELRLPDPSRLPARDLRRLLELVARRIEQGFDPDIETSLNRLVADLFALTPEHQAVVAAG